MEKRSLGIAFAVLLACAVPAISQTAQYQFPLTVTDNAGGTQQLTLGVDPTATDGIDAGLGETERPPVPITGVFDVRFIGDDIGVVGLGQGLINDYRQGTVNTTGTRIHELKYQVGTGTTITISWILPSWASGRLQDILTGTLIDVNMTGTGNYTVNNPGGFNKLKLTVTYTAPLPVQLVSFTGRVTNQQGNVRLDWRTMTETNNYGFYVQRSFSVQTDYQTVSELIPGHGTTLEPHDYSWTDMNGQPGIWYYRLKQVDLDGAATYTEGIIPSGLTDVKGKGIPTEFGLSQNYPNPFNPSTTIEFALPRQSDVRLEVYNLIGQRVATLVNSARQAGYHVVEFDATGFSSGLYFYRLTANNTLTIMKKMVLTK